LARSSQSSRIKKPFEPIPFQLTARHVPRYKTYLFIGRKERAKRGKKKAAVVSEQSSIQQQH